MLIDTSDTIMIIVKGILQINKILTIMIIDKIIIMMMKAIIQRNLAN